MKEIIMAKKKKAKGKKRKSRTETIDAAVPSLGRPKKLDGIEIYKVESALDTLSRAREIEKDEQLMKATEKLLERRQIALGEVEQSMKRGHK